MTRIARYLLFPVALMLVVSAHAASFTEAATAYRNGDFRACLAALDALHAGGKQAPESWLLDGNARASLDDFPGAILAYRRALMLDPNLAEARQNLQVLTRRGGIPEPGEPAPMKRMLDQLPRGSAWLAGALGLWMALAGARVWIRGGSAPLLTSLMPLTLGITLSLAAATAAIFPVYAGNINDPRWWQADAQLARAVSLFSAPARRSPPALESVPAGTAVRIIEDAGWAYVEVPSGNNGRPMRGWIEPGSWLLLRPHDDRILRGNRP